MGVGAAVVGGILLPLGIDLLKQDVLPWLVTLVDKLLGGKTIAHPDLGGSVKFPLVVAAAAAFDKVIASLGTATPSTPAQIEGAVQAMWRELDAAGLLVGHATIVPLIGSGNTLDDIIAASALMGAFAAWLKTSPMAIPAAIQATAPAK